MKTVFTTGEAAEICKVSQQTIIRCFDSGRLKGFRVPGSRFRRIPREALIAFMKDNNIPPDALDSGKTKVLVVDDDPEQPELRAHEDHHRQRRREPGRDQRLAQGRRRRVREEAVQHREADRARVRTARDYRECGLTGAGG